jgi:hypothetical protein
MSKPSSKKTDRRRKKEKEKAARLKAYDREQRRLGDVAAYEIVDHGADPAFVEAVKSAAESVWANFRDLLTPHVTYCQLIAKIGITATYRGAIEMTSEQDAVGIQSQFIIDLGNALYDHLPAGAIESFIPYSDVRPEVLDRTIRLKVRSLRSEKTSGGTAYFSPRESVVKLPDTELVAAFSRHAVERVCERTVYDWKSFLGSGDAFALLHGGIGYEAWKHGVQWGFKLYESCVPGFYSYQYAMEVLGHRRFRPKKTHYLVGYLPARQSGRLFVAKTLLTPGMDGTPEHSWYKAQVSDDPVKMGEFRVAVSGLTKKSLAESKDFSLIRQFHEAGIPQIKEFSIPQIQS